MPPSHLSEYRKKAGFYDFEIIKASPVLLFGFACIDRGDQHPADRAAVVLQRFVLVFRDVAGAVQ
jgi:hypothetical protein